MSFLVLPPEVNSALMFAGAGSGPTLAAAAAWDGLAAELGQAANSFSSATAALADTAWQGPAATAMAAAAAPYASWLSTAATRALSAAAQAKAAAAVYEAARAATVDPLLVAANRHQLVSLVLSNLFGQNAPAIAATEAAYEQLWAADVAAMVSYHSGASAVAAQLAPWAQAVRALPNPTAPALAGLVRTVAGDDVAAAGAGYPDRRGGGRRVQHGAATDRGGVLLPELLVGGHVSGLLGGRPVDVSGAGECGVLRPVDPSWSGPIPNLTHMTIAAGPMRTSGAERFCRRPGHAGRCHRSSLDHAAGLLASERASASSGATMLREREPGENPGLSRSGMQERPPSWK